MICTSKRLSKLSHLRHVTLAIVLGLLMCRHELSAQGFPWGSDKVKNTIAPLESDLDTLLDARKVTEDLPPSVIQTIEDEIGLPTKPENASAYKPGMSAYHLQHLGEKLNFDSLYKIKYLPQKRNPNYSRGNWIVYGFQPYWMGSAWKSYDFHALTHVAYFAYKINVKTGGALDMGDWKTTAVVDSAQAAGCKVHLTVTTVGSNGSTRDMLLDPNISEICIDSICAAVKKRNADGVCIDFEDMRSDDTLAFVNWIKNLKSALRKDNPKAEVAIAGIASMESSYFSLPSLDKLIDYMVIMGYDYTYSGSKNAGCTSPLAYKGSWLNLESTVDDYLQGGIAAQRLVLAIPYYGYQWKTVGSNGNDPNDSKVLDYIGTVTFQELMRSIVSTYSANYDSNSKSSYYVNPSEGGFSQAWVMDSASMRLRFEMIHSKKIAGVGIWALGFDNGETAMWNLIREYFGHGGNSGATADLFRRHNDNVYSGWVSDNLGNLSVILVGALLILTLIVVISRKAREEVLNNYFLFPLVAFLGLVGIVTVYEYVHDYLDWLSPNFPWIILVGTAVLVLGFYFGKSWSDKKNQDR